MQKGRKVKEMNRMDTTMAGIGRQFVKMANEIEQLLTDRGMLIARVKELEEKVANTTKDVDTASEK